MARPRTVAAEQARKGWPFFALFVLVGLGMTIPFILQGIRDYRIAFRYQPTECQVLGERTVSSSSTSRLGGTWYSTTSSHREFSWAYVVGGTRYVADGYDNHEGMMVEGQETGNVYPGVRMPCWYDPADPEKSVLARNFRAKFYLGALVPALFIVFPGWLLLRTVRPRQAYADVRVGRGQRLPFRLSPILSTRGIAGCLTVIIVALAAVMVFVLPRIAVGDVTPTLLGGLWPFIIVGAIEAFLIYHWWRAMRAARRADAVIEIGHHPLAPGQATSLHLRLDGPGRLARIRVSVLLERDSGNGTRVSNEKVLFEREDVDLSAGLSFDGEIKVSPRASPSLKTLQSVASWLVRVQRVTPEGLSYDTDYPFTVVVPPGGSDDHDEADKEESAQEQED